MVDLPLSLSRGPLLMVSTQAKDLSELPALGQQKTLPQGGVPMDAEWALNEWIIAGELSSHAASSGRVYQ
jgi:hypothetical protein